jgi:hypothetical protein
MPSAVEDGGAVLLPPIKAGAAFDTSNRTDAVSVWSADSAPQVSSQPFASTFASRAVDDADKFVLLALDKASGEGPSPRLGAGAVPGELDALAFAMGALWELADSSDVNQVSRAFRAHADAHLGAYGRRCTSCRVAAPRLAARGGGLAHKRPAAP